MENLIFCGIFQVSRNTLFRNRRSRVIWKKVVLNILEKLKKAVCDEYIFSVRMLLCIFPKSLNQLYICFEYSEPLTLPTMVNGTKDTFRKQVKK